jgi:hypothetical protein
VARIDGIFDDSLFETNFSRDPVSVRRRNRFWLYEQNVGKPPSLSAKIVSNRGWIEITGRGGSNLTSLFSAIGMFVLVAGAGGYVLIVEHDRAGIPVLLSAIPASVYAYWRAWKNPDAGYVIDYLQKLLEAQPIPQTLKL